MSHRFPHALPRVLLPYLAVALLLLSGRGWAGAEALQRQYDAVAERLSNNSFGVPIALESRGQGRTLQGDVYGVIQHPFARVRRALTTPANWCNIMQQHINIKACTYEPVDQRCQLTLYSGRKFYKNPEDVYRFDYGYELSSWQHDYFRSALSAEDGPLDTKDYRITAEAMPLTADSTFIHFRYSYHYGVVTRAAMAGYFASLGHNKVGFSVVDTDKHGKPVYVDGIQGVVERNSMRYYLAIQAFLDTQASPQASRFERRIAHWFDLTARYHPQLDELERHDYLRFKRKEQQDQLRLQRAIDRKVGIDGAFCKRYGDLRKRVTMEGKVS